MLRTYTALTFLIGLLLILAAGLPRINAMIPVSKDDTRPESEQQKVWADKCAMCHGKTGVPTPVGEKLGARNLTTPEVRDKSDQDLRTVIIDGSGKMPGYKDTLSPQEIDFLIRQIRTFAAKPAAPVQD